MFARNVETHGLVVITNVTLVGVTISHEAAPYQQQRPCLKNIQTKQDKSLTGRAATRSIRIRVGSLEFLGPWGAVALPISTALGEGGSGRGRPSKTAVASVWSMYLCTKSIIYMWATLCVLIKSWVNYHHDNWHQSHLFDPRGVLATAVSSFSDARRPQWTNRPTWCRGSSIGVAAAECVSEKSDGERTPKCSMISQSGGHMLAHYYRKESGGLYSSFSETDILRGLFLLSDY